MRKRKQRKTYDWSMRSFYAWLLNTKRICRIKKFGNVVKAQFSRLSPTPLWSWDNWYIDESRSGGAALDLHVHDVDFINYLFGTPKTLISSASNYVSGFDSITTIYNYDGFSVIATGDWGFNKTYPFTPSFWVRFEKAALELKNGTLTLYTDDEATELKIPSGNGYANEVIDFVSCIKENKESKINPPQSSFETLKIALKEKESAKKGKIIKL